MRNLCSLSTSKSLKYTLTPVTGPWLIPNTFPDWSTGRWAQRLLARLPVWNLGRRMSVRAAVQTPAQSGRMPSLYNVRRPAVELKKALAPSQPTRKTAIWNGNKTASKWRWREAESSSLSLSEARCVVSFRADIMKTTLRHLSEELQVSACRHQRQQST